MAGIVYTKLIDALKGIGVDVSQQQASNVKKLAPKNKSSATKVGLLAAERDTGGNFATVLDIFKDEAKYIDSMNDVEQMNFLNNILDYNEFGGKSIKVSKGIEATEEMNKLKNTQSELKKALEELNTSAKTLKDEAEAGKKKALEDLDIFMETGGQPLKAKNDKYLGGSMHEEGQLRTGIRQFLQTEYKNGRLKLDDLDKARVMEYSPMIEHDPILVFKKIYGDEAYKKAGEFPGAFEIGENFKHYEEIFRNNMGEDILKVKDKKYVGDGKLVLTDEVYEPGDIAKDYDGDIPFAKGGRASFAGGKLVSEFIALIVKKEPIEAMKEVNKVIGKKGKYKNLTQKDIDKIVADTEDHIFQRDPDNLYVYDDGKTVFDDDLNKDQLIEKESRAMDKADEMNFEDSIKEMEGLGATQTAERFKLKQKYPGITDDLLNKILIDDNPQRKAEVLATIDEAFRMMEKGKGPDEIVEIFKNTTRTKNAKGGRAGYYAGGQAMIEPDLSDIGHGSDSLMARTRLTSPGSQATTSTGLNYLLGEDNDNTRVPFNEGLLVPPSKPYTTDQFDEDSMLYLKGMYGLGGDGKIMMYNKMIEKGNILRRDGVDRETVIGIIRNNKNKIDEILRQQEFKGVKNKSLAGLKDGGRIGFSDGLSAAKKMGNIFDSDGSIFEIGKEDILEKIKSGQPEKKDEQEELFKMVGEYQKFKKDNPESSMSFFRFAEKRTKEKELFKNKIIALDVKYPEKKIINEQGFVDKENLKDAIDEAEANLEISPIDGLTLKRSINTEGEQSVTSGEFDIGNFSFSSPNLEEGKLKSKGSFDFGGLNLSGMVDTKDSNILNTELGFNYGNALEGKMTNSDGYRSTELDLNKTFPISDKFSLNLKGGADTQTFNGKTYRSSDLTPQINYNDGIFNASIAKEVIEGGDTPNLSAGINFNDFYLKGGNLLSEKDRSAVLGYQKEFGDPEGSAFFTIGGEIDPFTGEKTGGAGLKYKFADGGIAGLRPGYAGGTLVDKGRRGFLKFLGGTAAGVAALKTGLVKLLGKDSGAVSKKVIDEVIIDSGSGAPAWLQPLVNKALRDGTDITKKNAIVDGQVVKSLDTPTGKVDVYYNVRTGEVDVDYIGGNTALGESVNMRYTPGVADEGTKGVKPADEFEATEAIPEGRGYSYGDDYDYSIDVGENTTDNVKNLFSDTTELAELGGQKTLTKDIVETVKKKKVLKQMQDNPTDFITDVQGDYVPD